MRRIRADPPAQALVDDGAGGDWTTSPPVTTTLRSSRPELAPTPSTPDRCGLGRRPSARADTKNSGGTNPTRSSLVAGAGRTRSGDPARAHRARRADRC